jgi:hypothetical protein
MIKLLVVLLAAVASTSVFAEWIKVGRGNADFFLYADPMTIHQDGNSVKMLAMTDFKVTHVAGGLSFLSIKSQREFDCKDRKARILSFAWYPKNMGNGVAVHTDDEAFEWESVRADTTIEALWKIACSGCPSCQ